MAKAGGEPRGITVLLVEDEADTRELVRDMLVRKYPELNVMTAENGAAGLERYRAALPDIVITDLSMPLMDGIAMARQIRVLNPEAYLIVVSAHSDTGYLLDAIEIGINQYLLKPIVSRKLFGALDSCLETIRMRRLLKAQADHIRTLSSAVEGSSCSVMITDMNGVIEYINPKFCAVTGYAGEEVMGRTACSLNAETIPPETFTQLREAIAAGCEWHGELLNCRKNGELFWESVSISPCRNATGAPTHLVAVKEDITERKRAAQQIARLNADLADKVAELDAFNYTVSHDLRAPLSLINGYNQLIMLRWAGELPEKCGQYFREIHGATIRMNRLIDSLLDFSRLSGCELQRQPVDLSELIRRTAGDLRQMEPDRQLTLSVHDGMTVEGDPRLLAALVQNLLDNAFKYTWTREHARIELGVKESDGVRTFFVRDNGIGFDMADADRLFTPFRRLPGSEGVSGSGIGLATVKRIVQRHGGDIRAEAAPGEGAAFFFTLG